MIKSISKIIGVLFALDMVFFLGMIITAMTDDKPPAIGRVFYWVLKYILGFPMVLLPGDYPFFLHSNRMPIAGIFLMILLNNALLAYGVWRVHKAVRSA